MRLWVVLSMLVPALCSAAVIPAGRTTTWDPGLNSIGGIPNRTTICSTLSPTGGNDRDDIQSAIDSCPVGQVVKLNAGDFDISGANPVIINKGITLRGSGAGVTKLSRGDSQVEAVVRIGAPWMGSSSDTDLTADAAKGDNSISVTSASGFSVDMLVVVDETTDDSFVEWGTNGEVANPGSVGRGWFTRQDRPIGQMMKISDISGTTITFTTSLHMALRTAFTAQMARWSESTTSDAGIEDLHVYGGLDDNIVIRLAMHSWVKGVRSEYSDGNSIAIDASFQCTVRDSYFHSTPSPNPGGGGYMLEFSWSSADNLVENNIVMDGNKVMVMRASGGGNVIAYNYMDDGWIDYDTTWMETGLNASHLAEPHFELFEGNQAFNSDGDSDWGGAVYITFFRNHMIGKRRNYTDTDNRLAIGLQLYHYYYSYVGNVLGTSDQVATPYSTFTKEDFHPWEVNSNPVSMWRIGYNPSNWNASPDQRVLDTIHRHANYDYVSDAVAYVDGYDQSLPNSLYLTGKPAFFGCYAWPWVDATGPTKLQTLPARARFDAADYFADPPACGYGDPGVKRRGHMGSIVLP